MKGQQDSCAPDPEIEADFHAVEGPESAQLTPAANLISSHHQTMIMLI